MRRCAEACAEPSFFTRLVSTNLLACTGRDEGWFLKRNMPLGIDRRLLPIEPWNAPGGFTGWFESGTNPLARDWSVISEIPQTAEELQAEQRRLEAITQQEPFVPMGTVVLEGFDPGVVIGNVSGPDTAQQDELMAHDWGHFARQVGGSLFGLSGQQDFSQGVGTVYATPDQAPPAAASTAAGCDGMAWSGGTPPKGFKVVNYCGQGVLRKVRRRRRRRMLTASDASDLATIVGIVGKGQMASSMINRTRS